MQSQIFFNWAGKFGKTEKQKKKAEQIKILQTNETAKEFNGNKLLLNYPNLK